MEVRVLSKPVASVSWSRRPTRRTERLSTRAAIVLGSAATLLLWLGLTEALVQWM